MKNLHVLPKEEQTYRLIKEYPWSKPLGSILKYSELEYCNWDEYYEIIPKEENDYTVLLQPVGTKQETLEEIAEWLFKSEKNRETFIRGAKLQQEISYSEEEVKNIMAETWIQCVGNDGNNFKEVRDKILKQFKNK